MPLPRSEEFYQGGFRPYMQDDTDTLQLMREAKTRNLQQKGQVGDLTAESIREPAKTWSDTIKALPGAAGQGMEMRQSYDRRGEEAERHKWGAEEHVTRQGAAQRQAEMDRQNMEKVRQDMEFEQKKRDILLKKRGGKPGAPAPGGAAMAPGGPGGAVPGSEEGQSLLEQQIENELAAQAAGIESTKTGTDLSRAQMGDLSDQRNRRIMDDQATVNAYAQSKGIPAPNVSSSEGRKMLSEAIAAGKTKSAEVANELAYNTQNPQIKAKSDEVDANVGRFTKMQAATEAYLKTSDNPLADQGTKDLAIQKYNQEAEKLGLPPVGGYGGDITPTRTGKQMRDGLKQAEAVIRSDIQTLKRTKGNAPLSLNNKLAEHERTIDRKAQAIERLRQIMNPGAQTQAPVQPAGMGMNPKSRY